MTATEYGIDAVETSMELLDAIHELKEPNLTELAEHTGMAPSTTHIHLNTLENANYIVSENKRYKLSLRFLQYGLQTRKRMDLFEHAKFPIDELAKKSGELANLMMEEQGQGRYVYTKKQENAVYFEEKPGRTVPLHSTALGKAILAHLPDERVEMIIQERGLPEETPHTITDPDELRNELETIREEGIAHDREEFMESVRCMAVPLLKRDTVEGAISVSGPVSRMSSESFQQEIRELLFDTKDVIELGITYR